MKRSLSSFIASIALLAFCTAVHGATPTASGSVDDAQALKLAETKLAALAKEAKQETSAAGDPAPQKKVEKKRAQKPRKKRAKRPRTRQAGEPVLITQPQKVLGRRLTQGEVQNILSTTRDFAGTDLSGLNLAGIDFHGVRLNRANLHTANLERADLAESDLELADLSGADLRGASLNQARLRGTRLEGAKLDGALWIDKTICRKGSVGSCIE